MLNVISVFDVDNNLTLYQQASQNKAQEARQPHKCFKNRQ
ncbi:hypothetical protein PCIT_a3655 [Pseudoalteromonas citrea]|uniref:Uncharacterized protein n=1 Tax=Pseudoalteromonas citrea TaxID=43655 RepID=A0AAD4AG26_9GAMM|nr:hypothetical protein PCIT_a3655 [Pseudoalteromonas citrea]